MVTQKTEYGEVNGTPQKRVFLSIINDYDLEKGLCELVDNAIDMWLLNSTAAGIDINVILDHDRQMISVSDNAGGVKEEDFECLISPGASGQVSNVNSIGIFGVGGKRAGIALGELIEIKSRYKGKRSLQLDVTEEWLSSTDWNIKTYEIPPISKSTTEIHISKLRRKISEEDVSHIEAHFGETYARFIERGCKITVNNNPVLPIKFDQWSYPPEYSPRTLSKNVYPREDEKLEVKLTGGLISDRNKEGENYGVYFYCNDRLIVKELRTREVGYYIGSEAGKPHPDASLCRVIVDIKGKSELMPWNSSKSFLNFNHPSMADIRPSLIELVSYFTKLSRRTKNNWDEEVFAYSAGTIEKITSDEVKPSGKLRLPTLPRVRSVAYTDQIVQLNKKVMKDKPWTAGLVESMGMVNVLSSIRRYETNNRGALVLLDSNLEIALKEFIVNDKKKFPPFEYTDKRISDLFRSRTKVINEVSKKVDLGQTTIDKIGYYYNLRNKLIHERATVPISSKQVDDYRKVVEGVLRKLFRIRFPGIS